MGHPTDTARVDRLPGGPRVVPLYVVVLVLEGRAAAMKLWYNYAPIYAFSHYYIVVTEMLNFTCIGNVNTRCHRPLLVYD